MKLLRSILSITLALLVLLSSTSFMVGIHYCGGKIQDVALFTPADPCEAERSLPPCHRKMMAHCCEDEQVIHEADDLKVSSSTFQPAHPAAVDMALPEVVISEVVPSAPASRIQYTNYDPPLRSCDLTVEHHIFLI